MKTDIKDMVKSYEDACREIGEEPIADFGNVAHDEIAYEKLKTVIKALNEGWEPDYKDGTQGKWFPWFFIGSAGFTLKGSIFVAFLPDVSGAGFLCVKSEELADYAGRQFLDLWKGFIYEYNRKTKAADAERGNGTAE
jgi:hypothetical protein